MNRALNHRRSLHFSIVLAVASGLLTVGTPSAQAGLHNLFPADVDHDIAYVFTQVDSLWAIATSDVYGGRVCVVAGDATPGTAKCDQPAFGAPNAVAGVGTVYTLIEPGDLVPGTWRLLAEDQDKHPITVSDRFTVVNCPDCEPGIDDDAVNRFKSAAGQAWDGAKPMCALATSKTEPPSPLEAGKTIARGLLSAFGERVHYHEVGLGWTGGATVVAGGILNLFFDIPKLGNPGEEKAWELLQNVSCALAHHYQDIVNDPPDPDFDHVYPPSFTEINPDAIGPEAYDLAVALDRQVAYADSALVAYERYQGAVLADDEAAASAQATATGRNAQALASTMRPAAAALRAYAAVLEAGDPYLSEPLGAELADIRDLYTRVRTDGFTPEELDELHELNFTDNQIAMIRSHFSAPLDTLTPSMTLPGLARSLATIMEAQVDDFTAFASNALIVGANTEPPPNSAPVATPDTFAAQRNRALTVAAPGVLGNDTDADHDALTAVVASAPAHGSLDLAANGSFVYTPATGYVGADGFTYKVTDGEATSAAATVTLNVANSNAAPVAFTDSYPLDEDTVLTVGAPGLLGNDTDADHDPLTVTARTQTGTAGTLELRTDGSFTFTPGSNISANLQYFYTASDGITTANGLINLTVRGVNDPPVAAPDHFTAAKDRTLTFAGPGVLANDSDLEGDTLTARVVTGPTHGSLNLATTGSFTYTPEAGFTGTDQFTYVTSDRTLSAAPATATINVTVPTSADRPDSLGTEFWLGFMSNYSFIPTLSLFISGPTATSGTVTIPGRSFNRSFSVTPGAVTTVVIPGSTAMNPNVVDNLGVHVVADSEVTVYGHSHNPNSSDAYLGLPVDALGTDYVALGSDFGPSRSEGAVVATADGTTVTITPSATAIFDANGGARTPFTIVLNKGQTYEFQARSGDVSGTAVSATKPVAVFGGNQCANIPVNIASCDHIVEQMPPTSTWGRSFLTVPLKTRLRGDTFRVVSAHDATTVRVNGTVVATLDRGQALERVIEGAAQVTADKPILLGQYANSTQYDGVGNADPFEMLIPPTEQFLTDYTVTTVESGFAVHFVNVVAPTSATVHLDGAPVPASAFAPIGSSGFSGAQLTVAPGTHTLSSLQPIGLTVYGFDYADSYGYPAGQSFARIAAVSTLTVTPKTQAATIGGPGCVTATAKDALGAAVPGARVTFVTEGAHPDSTFKLTNAAGAAEVCLSAATVGTDTVTATLGAASDASTITWQERNLRPVADSRSVSAVSGRATPIALTGSDPDGDPITFAVASGPGHGTLTGTGSDLTYTADAAYAGPDSFTFTVNDGTVDSEPATVSITVTAESTTVVTSSTNPSLAGDPVTFTATVTSAAGVPVGEVVLRDGSTVVATAAVGATGRAVFTGVVLASGRHPITATYTGSAATTGSSGAVVQNVNRALTRTTVTSSANPAKVGTTITFTAKVASPGRYPTGSVTFTDGSEFLGTTPVGPTGLATWSATLPAGIHQVTASFDGADRFLPSSGRVRQVVRRLHTTLALDPAILRINPGITPTLVFRGRLTDENRTTLDDRVIAFSAGGRIVCQVRTDVTGVARCKMKVTPFIQTLLGRGYNGTFAGDASHDPTTSHARLIQSGLPA